MSALAIVPLQAEQLSRRCGGPLMRARRSDVLPTRRLLPTHAQAALAEQRPIQREVSK